MQYPIAVLDRTELQRYLSVSEVDLLNEQDMQEIAQAMMQELHELGFWDQVAFIVRCRLAEKRGTTHGA